MLFIAKFHIEINPYNHYDQLSLVGTVDIGDKYEHTVQVNGTDRFLDSTALSFGRWDTKTQSIQLTGQFVDMHLKDQPDIIFEVKFENVPSGLMAKIEGQF